MLITGICLWIIPLTHSFRAAAFSQAFLEFWEEDGGRQPRSCLGISWKRRTVVSKEEERRGRDWEELRAFFSGYIRPTYRMIPNKSPWVRFCLEILWSDHLCDLCPLALSHLSIQIKAHHRSPLSSIEKLPHLEWFIPAYASKATIAVFLFSSPFSPSPRVCHFLALCPLGGQCA